MCEFLGSKIMLIINAAIAKVVELFLFKWFDCWLFHPLHTNHYKGLTTVLMHHFGTASRFYSDFPEKNIFGPK